MEHDSIKILAIDDIPDNLISLKALIRDAFPEAVFLTAPNGVEGLRQAAINDPDVILLDIVMPGMDGFDVCKKLKGDKKLCDIPVVFLTAMKGDRENRIKALDAGAEAFLAKPIDETELKAQVSAMLKIRSANLEKRDENYKLAQMVKRRTRELEKELIKQKHTEESLRKSEAKFKDLFENQMEAYALHKMVYDETGKPSDYTFIEVNNAFLKSTGLKYKSDIIGKTVLGIWPQTERYWIDIYGKVASTQQPVVFENYSAAMKKYFNVSAYSNEKGFFSTSFWDITDRKMSENVQHILYNISNQVLRASSIEQLLEMVRDELNQVFDTANFFVAMYDPENDMLRQIIFKDENDSFKEWKASNTYSGKVVKEGKPLLMTKQEIESEVFEKNKFFKGTMPVCWLGVPLKVQDEAIGVMVIQSYNNPNAYDARSANLLEMVARELSLFIERRKMIDDLVIAKEKAQESDRLKSAFLANMSHEIRTPMNGILGFAQLLKNQELSGEQQKKFIGIIEKSGHRMLNIINDLINISKIESGQMEILLSEVNVNEQMHFLYDFFSPELQKKNKAVHLNKDIPDKPVIISTDQEKLVAILTNLLKNAVKFTDQGMIRFGYLSAPSHLEFYVSDSGIGIPKDKQQTIFERFIQADLSVAGPYEGAGLGLSIAKAYIELLGGRIWVESREDQGSTFRFTLPVINVISQNKEQGGIEIPDTGSEAHSDKASKLLKVLIVEDDEASDMLLSMSLEKLSREIIHVKSGRDAVEKCLENKDIDIIFMDIKMPGISGYEATREIRKFNQDVIIIAQTAFAMAGDREKALAAGCTDYLSKPIRKASLLEVIGKHI